MLDTKHLKDFSLMLSESVVDNKKELVKQSSQLDVKYQVKLLLDIIGILVGSRKVNGFVTENTTELETVKSRYKYINIDKELISDKIGGKAINRII
jgi:hypothetical protein